MDIHVCGTNKRPPTSRILTELLLTCRRCAKSRQAYMEIRHVYLFLRLLRSLGPVVQSVVSLTSSLRVISLTVLADSIHNILIFFAEKM